MDSLPSRWRTLKGSLYLMAGILILAAGLRIYRLGERVPWTDERISLNNAVGSIREQPITTPDGSFTPRDFWQQNTPSNLIKSVVQSDGGNAILYHILLHYWIRLFGAHEFWARLLSVVGGLATVVVLYQLAKELFGESTAQIAAVLAAIHPVLIYQSQQARTYALAILVSLVSTLIFTRIVLHAGRNKSPSRVWIAYGLSIGASLLFHYLTLSILIGQAIFAAVYVRQRAVWYKLLKGMALAGLMVSIWMPIGGKQGFSSMTSREHEYQQALADQSAPDWVVPATPRTIAAGWVQLMASETGNLLQNAGIKLSKLILLLFIPVSLISAYWFDVSDQNERGAILLLVLLAISPALLATLLAFKSGHTISFSIRYGTFAIPYLCILLAGGVMRRHQESKLKRLGRSVAALAQIALMLFSVSLVYRDIEGRRPTRVQNVYRQAAQQIAATWTPGDVVIYSNWEDARMCTMYLPSDSLIRQRVENGINTNAIMIRKQGAAPVLLASIPHERVW